MNRSEASDLELLKRSADDDSAAFHELVDRHADRLYRLAVSLLGNATDAEDVLQETFAGAYKGLRKFEQRSSVKTWLTRILVLQASKWRRDRKKPMAAIETDAPHPAGEADSRKVEHTLDVQAALKKLSPEHREILMLREFEHLSYEEIAAVLEMPRGTVESRIFRARAELRDHLKAYRP